LNPSNSIFDRIFSSSPFTLYSSLHSLPFTLHSSRIQTLLKPGLRPRTAPSFLVAPQETKQRKAPRSLPAEGGFPALRGCFESVQKLG
jgi:hypothetical protein